MVKFKKDKLKETSKLTKKLQASPTNKILKKKVNIEKKVTFHKETLLKETAKSDHLVKNVKPKSGTLKKLPKKGEEKIEKSEHKTQKPKQKSVEKKKKRQKTQVYDTKLILSLMKKKFNENEAKKDEKRNKSLICK